MGWNRYLQLFLNGFGNPAIGYIWREWSLVKIYAGPQSLIAELLRQGHQANVVDERRLPRADTANQKKHLILKGATFAKYSIQLGGFARVFECRQFGRGGYYSTANQSVNRL